MRFNTIELRKRKRLSKSIKKKVFQKNKKKISLLLLTLLITFTVFTIETEAFYISNNLENRYTLDLENTETYDALTILNCKIEEGFANSILYINPYLNYNYQDEDLDFGIEEAYVDLYFTDVDLRIGKQQITWGKADGLVVTNLVNPRDYTRYPIFEYEEQFQAVNAVKTNYYFGSDSLELIWLPEFQPALIDSDLIAANLEGFKIDNTNIEIETKLENSELLMRYSSLGYDYDYELIAGYIWDDQVTFHNKISIPPDNHPFMTIIPEHHRLMVVGGSFSTIQGSFVLRGEGTYTIGKHYNINSKDIMEYKDGVVEKELFKWLAGIDYNYQGYQFSYQLLQEAILDYEDSIEQDQFTYQMTFMVKKPFFRETMDTELSFYYDTVQEQLMVKPKIVYDYSDQINFSLGANYQLEGQRKDDVLYFSTEYLF